MSNLEQNYQDFQAKRQQLVDLYVKRMEIEYNIKNVTTARQSSNGTIMFQLPNGEKIGSYKSGYVRRCSSKRVYQLNKVYKQEQRWTLLSSDKLKTTKAICYARELILDPMARLVYIVEFCKRNYNMRSLANYAY